MKSLFVIQVITLLALAVAPSLASSTGVIVLLGSDASPYLQAVQGFKEAFGRPVEVKTVAEGMPDIPKDTRMIVTFGGKAAILDFPKNIPVVYGLAPSVDLPSGQRKAPTIGIHTSPQPRVILDRMKRMQPGLRRFVMFWSSRSISPFVVEMERASKELGLVLVVEKIEQLDQLPDRLRSLDGSFDAIWLPPDPQLVTPQSFATLKEFCASRHVMFYAPTDILVEKGAVASISSSFTEIGRSAAQVSQKLLADGPLGPMVFPQNVSVTLNLSAASRAGLAFAPEVLREAHRVIQ
jgi:ABC-type uncharacterized transport system substrate-binding protein